MSTFWSFLPALKYTSLRWYRKLVARIMLKSAMRWAAEEKKVCNDLHFHRASQAAIIQLKLAKCWQSTKVSFFSVGRRRKRGNKFSPSSEKVSRKKTFFTPTTCSFMYILAFMSYLPLFHERTFYVLMAKDETCRRNFSCVSCFFFVLAASHLWPWRRRAFCKFCEKRNFVDRSFAGWMRMNHFRVVIAGGRT